MRLMVRERIMQPGAMLSARHCPFVARSATGGEPAYSMTTPGDTRKWLSGCYECLLRVMFSENTLSERRGEKRPVFVSFDKLRATPDRTLGRPRRGLEFLLQFLLSPL